MEEVSGVIPNPSEDIPADNSGCQNKVPENYPSKIIKNMDVSTEISAETVENRVNGDDYDDADDVVADKPKSLKRSRVLFDSDSEDDAFGKKDEGEKELNGGKSSDDDEDTVSKIKKTKNGFSRVKITSDSDSDDEVGDEENKPTSVTAELKKKPAKFSTLIDSESEEEPLERTQSQTPYDNEEHEEQGLYPGGAKNAKSQKSQKSKNQTKRAAKDDAMNKIRSETQRLIRESSLSLPYHRPKQRTLEDFLNRRKVSSALPKTLTMANKLKTSASIVNCVLEEKEKEAETFYQSSESEEDMEVPDDTDRGKSPEIPVSDSTEVSIEDTQKLQKSDLQSRQHMIHNGSLEFGAPRKLILDGPSSPQTSAEIPSLKNCEKILEKSEENSKNSENNIENAEENVEKSAENLEISEENLENSEKKLETPEKSLETSEQNFDNSKKTPDKSPEKNLTEPKRALKQVSIPRKLSEDPAFESNPDIPKLSTFDSGLECMSTQDSELTLENVSEASASLETNSGPPESSHEATEMQQDNSEDMEIDCAISDTPIISNKEFLKLNIRPSANSEISDLSGDKIENDEKIDETIDGKIDEENGNLKNLDCLLHPQIDKDNLENENLNNVEMEENNFETPSSSNSSVQNKVIPAAPKVKKGLSKVGSLKPEIKGDPGTMIDLTNSGKPNRAVDILVGRFLKKHAPVTRNEKNAEVTILTTEMTPEGLKVNRESLLYKPCDIIKSDDPDLQKPGAKLLKLKEELERQMATKRNAEWKQRTLEFEQLDEEETEEIEESDVDEEMEDESADTEPEEDDIKITDKKRETHQFADDEAEVSETEDIENNEANEEDEDEEEIEDDEEKSEEEVTNDDEDNSTKPKQFSRIIQPTSDSEDSNPPTPLKSVFDRRNTDVDMFTDEEPEISTSQMGKTPARTQQLSLISPLSHSNRPVSQQLSDSTISQCLFSQLSDLSPGIGSLTSPKSPGELEKVRNKLFDENQTSANEEDLMALCSGKFPDDEVGSQRTDLKGLVDSASGGVTESQLANLCSGSFSTQLEVQESLPEPLDDFKLTFEDHEPENDESDFKLTFENPEPDKKTTEKALEPNLEDIPRSRLDIASSSDDETTQEKPKKNKILKKRVQKLVLSDDEDSEESDLEDIEESDEEKFIDYDSEENERIVSKKDLKKVATKYLEEEAELSENEVASADEDEKDLDEYEMEEGDTEDIDEGAMRDQIEKIHARQMQDEDNRDVRMLKELLFDDGDLHEDGEARERQFRWKNIDKEGLQDAAGPEDEEEGEDEPVDADEAEWRKLRLERQKFLMEKGKEADADPDLEGLFSLGLKALKRNNTLGHVGPSEKKKTIVPRSVSEFMQCHSKAINLASKRGSFLSRGEETLAKIASMTKQTDTVNLTTNKAGNFLFSCLSPSVTEAAESSDVEAEKETEKKKGKQVRKRKKSAAGVTPKTVKRAKVEGQPTSAKKLF